MPRTIRTVVKTAAATLLLAAVARTFTACTGCGRDAGTGTADTMTVAERAEVNLAQTPYYDPDALASLAHAVDGHAHFAPDDISTMIILCEGAVSHLQAEADNLQRNDDPADSYNVLSEFAESPVADNVRTIYNYLSLQTTTLTPQQAARHIELTHAISHLNGTVDMIQTAQLNGRQIFNL